MEAALANNTDRVRRSRLLYGITGGASLVVGLYLVWALRDLILPSVIGALSAYICMPVLHRLIHWGIPRKVGILLLVCGFICAIALIVVQVRALIPTEVDGFKLRTQAQYSLVERYEKIQPHLPKWVRQELEPPYYSVNEIIALDANQRKLFHLYITGYKGPNPVPPKYQRFDESNRARMAQWREKGLVSPESVGTELVAPPKKEGKDRKSVMATLLHTLSLWFVTPFVFLFLLFDERDLLNYIVSWVPNRYFEVSLTVIQNVDRALGNYLRGITLECGLVGLTLAFGLWLFGVQILIAMGIGLIAGIANAIPFLGPAIGLIVGAAYAMIAQGVDPVLPFVSPDDLFLGVLVSVGIAQTLDNAYFQPIVLGTAVNLPPLLVVFGVMGGSILFGIVGMLFAVPVLVIIKVILSTMFTELRAYYII